MASLQELLAQRAQLEQEIHSLQSAERGKVISQIRQLMGEFGLTMADVSGKGSQPKISTVKGSTAHVKYRNHASGETWSGRGLQPRWLKAALAEGKSLTDFSVDAPAAPLAPVELPVVEEIKPTGPRRVKKEEATPPATH